MLTAAQIRAKVRTISSTMIAAAKSAACARMWRDDMRGAVPDWAERATQWQAIAAGSYAWARAERDRLTLAIADMAAARAAVFYASGERGQSVRADGAGGTLARGHYYRSAATGLARGPYSEARAVRYADADIRYARRLQDADATPAPVAAATPALQAQPVQQWQGRAPRTPVLTVRPANPFPHMQTASRTPNHTGAGSYRFTARYTADYRDAAGAMVDDWAGVIHVYQGTPDGAPFPRIETTIYRKGRMLPEGQLPALRLAAVLAYCEAFPVLPADLPDHIAADLPGYLARRLSLPADIVPAPYVANPPAPAHERHGLKPADPVETPAAPAPAATDASGGPADAPRDDSPEGLLSRMESDAAAGGYVSVMSVRCAWAAWGDHVYSVDGGPATRAQALASLAGGYGPAPDYLPALISAAGLACEALAPVDTPDANRARVALQIVARAMDTRPAPGDAAALAYLAQGPGQADPAALASALDGRLPLPRDPCGNVIRETDPDYPEAMAGQVDGHSPLYQRGFADGRAAVADLQGLWLVQGRSVDGTVYAGTHGTWHASPRDAAAMPLLDAAALVDATRAANRERDADSAIGRLALIPHGKFDAAPSPRHSLPDCLRTGHVLGRHGECINCGVTL